MEIVTWVLQGSLVHQDSTGHSGIIYPGLAQWMSAGTGMDRHNGASAIRVLNKYAALYAVRFTATGGQKVTATEPAEILVWEMHAAVSGW